MPQVENVLKMLVTRAIEAELLDEDADCTLSWLTEDVTLQNHWRCARLESTGGNLIGLKSLGKNLVAQHFARKACTTVQPCTYENLYKKITPAEAQPITFRALVQGIAAKQ